MGVAQLARQRKTSVRCNSAPACGLTTPHWLLAEERSYNPSLAGRPDSSCQS
jgi:hypothetical protein